MGKESVIIKGIKAIKEEPQNLHWVNRKSDWKVWPDLLRLQGVALQAHLKKKKVMG